MTASLNLAGLVGWFDGPLVTICDHVAGAPGLTPPDTTLGGTTGLKLLDAFARIKFGVL